MNARRRFLALAAVTAAAALAGACGVKGPLYLPEESEDEQKEEDKDDENVSERSPASDIRGKA